MKKLALITGGTSGIGLGAAKELAPICELALSYAANGERAAAAVKELAGMDAKAKAFAKPLRSYQDCKELLEMVKQEFGRMPDILVSSHGRIQDGIFLQT